MLSMRANTLECVANFTREDSIPDFKQLANGINLEVLF